MNKPPAVGIERCRPDAKLPFYAHEGDAGMDICAAEDVMLTPGETIPVPTGLKFTLPHDMEIQVRPRSGLSLNTPLRLPNSPGTIDAGYRDELLILVHNSSCTCRIQGNDRIYTADQKGNLPGTYLIRKGDRIAQLVFARVAHVSLMDPGDLDAETRFAGDRGGGFGHSGIR